VVFHAGTAGPLAAGGSRERAAGQLREHLLPLLDGLDRDRGDGPDLLVEGTAGGGQPLAATVDELAAFVALLDGHPRLGLCLDTCHAFAAGEDLTAPRGVRRVLDHLVLAVGRGRLRLVHANGSKDALGSTGTGTSASGPARSAGACSATCWHTRPSAGPWS